MAMFYSYKGILDVVWLGILFLMLHHFWRVRRTLMQARYWLKTKGYVTQYEWTQTNNSVWPKIKYTYEVDEKAQMGTHFFTNTLLHDFNSKYARQVAYKTAKAFNEHAEIEVYYNPDNPEQAALDVTIPKKINVIIGLLCVFLLVHLVVISHRLLT